MTENVVQTLVISTKWTYLRESGLNTFNIFNVEFYVTYFRKPEDKEY